MNDNNNDNTGDQAGPQVVSFDRAAELRARLERENKDRAGKTASEVTQGQGTVLPRDFEAVVEKLVDDKVVQQTLNYNGFVIATPTFIGFTDVDGLVIGVIPIDRVVYVRPLSTDEKNSGRIA